MFRRNHPPRSSGNAVGRGSSRSMNPFLELAIFCFGFLACFGVIIYYFFLPSEFTSNSPGTNSLLSTNQVSERGGALTKKVLEWLPSHHSPFVTVGHDDSGALPDWSKEFWTPIDIDVTKDPIVILCKLNFKKYYEQPHSYPMFRDLEQLSSCIAGNRRREKLSVLMAELKRKNGTEGGRVISPTGFVFHESRVGSTLVANFLASDPYNMVFSESTPIANAILHCTTCSRETHVKLFRDVVTLMGTSPIHKRMYVKFQSITVTNIEIALEAFPETPWAFLYRQPVQTMMSHLDPKKGNFNAAPCLRSKRGVPDEVRKTLNEVVGSTSKASNEAWCAAHLNMLCTKALNAYKKYSKTSSGRQRGLLINYESLPGMVPKLLLPYLFQTDLNQNWLNKMQAESKHYSKSRGSRFRLFFGDSKDKDERATQEIQTFAEKILIPTYQELNQLSFQAVQALAPSMLASQDLNQLSLNWNHLKEFPEKSFIDQYHLFDLHAPTVSNQLSATSASVGTGVGDSSASFTANEEIPHSQVLKDVEFVPWGPFSNHHHSKTFYKPHCPILPDTDYPKAFSMLDILNNWNADDTEIPPFHYDSICHFDYQNATELQIAMKYRERELPFVMYNIPEVDAVVKKWNNLDYLSSKLGSKAYRTETSKDNHFMYWRRIGGAFLRTKEGKVWKPPTGIISTKFEKWLEVAVKGQNKSLESREHQYFRVSSDMGNEWLFNELPFFQPKKSVFIVQPSEQRGIHCRFGMRSVIAEAHFDGSRNAVVMLGGLRRWILTHPDQCKNMHMLMNNHPSGRHSAVDWSKPDIKTFPNFAKVMGNEVILRPGDYLFVPTYWIHYIVSLNVNFQCNTRSGVYSGYNKFIRECGF